MAKGSPWLGGGEAADRSLTVAGQGFALGAAGDHELPGQVVVGAVAAEGGGKLVDVHVVEAGGAREAAQLGGLEAEPGVGLLAHRLVVVAGVVDDDDGAAGGRERREPADDARRLRRV